MNIYLEHPAFSQNKLSFGRVRLLVLRTNWQGLHVLLSCCVAYRHYKIHIIERNISYMVDGTPFIKQYENKIKSYGLNI